LKVGKGTPGGVKGESSGGEAGMADITADVGEVADMVEYDDFLLFCDRAVSPLNAGI
jgi:hypothetical protein